MARTLAERKIKDIESRDLLKIILITDTPNPKDKVKIFDAIECRPYLKSIDKSRTKLKHVHVTYVQSREDTEETNPNYSFSQEVLIRILAKCDEQNKIDNENLKIVFVGENALKAFKKDYNCEIANPIYNIATTTFDEEKQIFEIKCAAFQDKVKTIPYVVAPDLSTIISEAGKIKLIEFFESLSTNALKDSEELKNAKFISVLEFIDHLDYLKQLYLDKKINYIAFDIETNTVEWAENWSKICLISVADLHTNMAYSCAQYHPELWMSNLRKQFFSELFSGLNDLINSSINQEFVEKSMKLIALIKEFKTKKLIDNKEVISYFEDEFLANVNEVLAETKSKSAKKSGDIEAVEKKKKLLLDLATDNKDVMSKIKFLMSDETHMQNVQKLWNKLDEVLSIIPIVGQNIKFDVAFVYSKNIARDKIKIAGDTLAEACMFSKVLDEHGLKMDLDLESLYERETGKQNGWKSIFKSSDRLKVKLLGTRFDNVELDKLGPYSALDSYCTLLLHEFYQGKMKERIKEDGCNKVETFLKEQYKAIEMFCSGEIFKWSPLTDATKKLYDRSLIDMEEKFNNILNLKMVQKFLADNPEAETFKINTAGAQSHKAIILFDKRYFGFMSILAGKSGAPSTDTDKVLKVLLSAIKNTLTNNLPTFSYRLADRTLKEKDRTWSMPVTEGYKELLQEAKVFIESLLDYSAWNKLNTAYISSVWDNEKQQSLPYRANFKIVNATLSGRLSSGMHTMPKEGNIRDLYCSIWNSDSNRQVEVIHDIGKVYNPDYGLVEVEYEDGSKETTTYKALQQQGLV